MPFFPSTFLLGGVAKDRADHAPGLRRFDLYWHRTGDTTIVGATSSPSPGCLMRVDPQGNPGVLVRINSERRMPGIFSPKLFYRAMVFAVFAFEGMLRECAGSIYESNLIIPPDRFQVNHGASISELSNGILVACWYAGSRESAADVQIYCSRRGRQARAWSAPAVAVGASEKADDGWLSNRTLGNTALHSAPDGTLRLFYNATTLGRGWSMTHVAYKVSRDLGATWSNQGTRITRYWGNSIRNKPLTLADGRLLLPMYREFIGPTYSYSCMLTPRGQLLADPQCSRVPGYNHLQPALIHLPDGRIAGYLRNASKANVLVAVLNPKLDQWSAPRPINLPNPNAPVDLVTTGSNRLVMIYNHSRSNRSALSAAVSADGFQFTWLRHLEYDLGSGGFSYPAIIRDRQGLFHLVYTYRHRRAIKHAVFDEEWLGVR